MIRRPALLGGLLLCLASWPVSDTEARNRDFETSMSAPSGNFVPAPEPRQPTWAETRASQTFEAAGDAGNFATDFGDPAGAAAESLDVGPKGAHTRATVRDQLIQNGQIQMDKNGVFRDKATGKVVSRKTLDKTAKKMNDFGATVNRTKQSKGWQKAKGGLEKVSKFGGMGEMAQTGGTAAGEVFGGEYVQAGKTGANHVLSNSSEAAGGAAGMKAGAAVGGFIGGPPGAVVGGVLGGAAGAYGGGKAYDEYGKPIVEGGIDKGAEIYYGDPRGKDAQGRADIAAEQELLTPEARERLQRINRMRGALTPEAFDTWMRTLERPPPVFGPPRAEDLRDPAFDDALTKIKTGIYDSNRDHPDHHGIVPVDPDGALAAAERAVLDRIAQLEKDVEWEVGEEARIKREMSRREELARLREEQQRIAEERERRSREAAQAGQMLGTLGAILGAMGQGMSQHSHPSSSPENHPHPSSAPMGSKKKKPHSHPDGSWD